MKNIINWLRSKLATLALATASVEKDMFKQTSVELEGTIGYVQRHNQGTLADSLNRGEITQEVKELRWRLFKILETSDKMMVNSLSTDSEGYHELDVKKTTSATIKSGLKKIKLDDKDIKINLPQWFSIVGHIPQEIFISDDSIKKMNKKG